MDPHTWELVCDTYERARELEPAHRDEWIARAQLPASVRAEVERLLESNSRLEPGFLQPRVEVEPELPDSVPALKPGTRIGGVEILRTIASGGMGTVYEGLQAAPRRRVALKTLRSGFVTPSLERRFRLEAEILGRLAHPAIAQVYDAGFDEAAGVPYFAMELVPDARDVLRYAREEDLSRRARVQMFFEVCEAVHYGHQKGVIHRDLKPNNVLVDGHGRPRVIDFGLARVLGEDHGISIEETRAGNCSEPCAT